MTSYHVGVEGWGQPLVVQVIPVYGAEEYVVLDLSLQKEGADQKQPSPWVLPSPPHMALSSSSIGSWLSSPKTLAEKVTCTSGWFPGTTERAFCSQTLPFWITRNPTPFPHDICLFHIYLLNTYSVPAPVGFEGMSLNKTVEPALRIPRKSWGPRPTLP